MDKDCPEKYFWCSNDGQFEKGEVLWAAGQPDPKLGDCVYFKVKNATNASSLFTGNCAEEKNFVCEVRRKGTAGKAQAIECMELWDVTERIIFYLF